MSGDENLEDILENLDGYEVDPTEMYESSSYECSRNIENEIAERLFQDIPDLDQLEAKIYTPSSALKYYELEGELPEYFDVILEVEGDLGAGESRECEKELRTEEYNVKVREHVNRTGLRRIL